MKLTDRDIEILRFINDCGYCVTPHLMTYFSVKQMEDLSNYEEVGKSKVGD